MAEEMPETTRVATAIGRTMGIAESFRVAVLLEKMGKPWYRRE